MLIIAMMFMPRADDRAGEGDRVGRVLQAPRGR